MFNAIQQQIEIKMYDASICLQIDCQIFFVSLNVFVCLFFLFV